MAREDYITDTDIRDLQIEANNAGDLDQVAICMVALGDDCSDEGDDEHYPIAKPATTPPKCALTQEEARAECVRVIENAEARADTAPIPRVTCSPGESVMEAARIHFGPQAHVIVDGPGRRSPAAPGMIGIVTVHRAGIGAVMITIHADDCSAFQVAPRDQGQMVEYAYATTEGGYVRRTTDRSDPSVSYEYAECNDYDEFEPQNGRVPEGPWAPAHITYEPILKGIEVEGRIDPETGAGVDALARRLTEKLGRAGQLPPKAQAEFDARERS